MSEYIFFSVEMFYSSLFFFFFFNDTATTEIYTLSLHDALPISGIFLTHMVDAFEVARNVLDLPTLLGTDRKSTRLNSSHGYISYAVFCLKKKKKKTTHRGLEFYTSTRCTHTSLSARAIYSNVAC